MSDLAQAEKLYNSGIAQYEQGNYDAAIDFFNQAIEQDSQNAQYFYNIGLAQVKKQDYNVAIDSFSCCLSLNPDDSEACYNMGVAYFERGDVDLAITTYNKAINLNPNDFSPYDSLGSAYYSKENFDAALKSFKKAAELAPSTPSVLYNLAYTYYVKEQYKEAKEVFEKVIKIAPSDTEAHFNLANVCIKLKDYNGAKDIYEKIISKDPQNTEAQEALAKINKIIESGGTDVEITERVSGRGLGVIKKGDSNILFFEAKTLLEKKDLMPAIAKFKDVIRLNPKHLSAGDELDKAYKLLQTGRTLLEQAANFESKKDLISAFDCYKKALQIHPFDEKAKEKYEVLQEVYYKNQAELKQKSLASSKQLIDSGDFIKAIEILKAYVNTNPEVPEAQLNLGKAYKETQEYKLAFDALSKALSLDNANREIQQELFEVTRLVNTYRDPGQGYIQLALKYVNSNDYNKAFAALKMASETNSNNPKIESMIAELSDKILQDKKSLSAGASIRVANAAGEISKCKKLIEEDPKNVKAYYDLAVAYMTQDRNDDAMDALKKLLSVDPNHKEAQNMMFDIFRRK